ncbi:MAG: hypothetical protein JNL38_34285 [Myxococcales bacterium]|nr:hypothetical protein [Myxococcales bacterium]
MGGASRVVPAAGLVGLVGAVFWASACGEAHPRSVAPSPLTRPSAAAAPALPPRVGPAPRDVAVGARHACEVRADGSVACWGDNPYGELGDGTSDARAERRAVVGLPPAAALTAGPSHTCALTRAGEVYCWGKNEHDAVLGDGTLRVRRAASRVAGVRGAVRIAARSDESCALLETGAVVCWGGPVAGLREIAGAAGATDLAAAGSRSCAVVGGRIVCWGEGRPARDTPKLEDVLRIAVARGHLCAVTRAARVVCVGALDATPQTSAPTSGPLVDDVVDVSTSDREVCARRASGEWLCWGAPLAGEGANARRPPRPIPSASLVVHHGDRACARADQVECFGALPPSPPASAPSTLTGAPGATAIATSPLLTCALTPAGIVCWRSKSEESAPEGAAPLRIAAPPAVAIAGGHEICALHASGAASCFAPYRDEDSRCHDAKNAMRADPVRGLRDAIAVAVGERRGEATPGTSCAVTKAGRVACWRPREELDPGRPRGDLCAAIAVSGLPEAARVALDGERLCAIRRDGRVACVLQPSHVTVGAVPPDAVTVVAGVERAVEVVARGGHACALEASGTVKCWGSGDRGQLGEGGWRSSDDAVLVAGLTDATALAAGDDHTCALRRTGAVVCWGGNQAAQLGDGTTLARPTPVPVGHVHDAIALTAGANRTCAARAGGPPVCWGAAPPEP